MSPSTARLHGGSCTRRLSHFMLTVALVVAVAVQPASALMLALTTFSSTCLVEEVGRSTTHVTGTYLWHKHPKNALSQVSLTLYTPSSAAVQTIDLIADEPSAPGDAYDAATLKQRSKAFSIEVPKGSGAEIGAYTLCVKLRPPPQGIGSTNPVYLSIDVDQAATANIKEKKQEAQELRRVAEGAGAVAELEAAGGGVYSSYIRETGRQLTDLRRDLERVHDNLKREKGRSGRAQETTESTFTRVWVMSIVSVTVVAAVVFAQFRWLNSTIVKRKLI